MNTVTLQQVFDRLTGDAPKCATAVAPASGAVPAGGGLDVDTAVAERALVAARLGLETLVPALAEGFCLKAGGQTLWVSADEARRHAAVGLAVASMLQFRLFLAEQVLARALRPVA